MVRFAGHSDMNTVRALWKARFGDSDEFMDFFFEYRAKPEYTVVFEEDNNEISSALQIHPVTVSVRDTMVPGAMLCGVCTSEKYEGRGRMGACLSFAIEHLSQSQCAVIVQKPVDFAIYKSYGFSEVNDSIYFKTDSNNSVNNCEKIDPFEYISFLYNVYASFSSTYSGMLIRSIDDLSVKFRDHLCDSGSCYAVFDSNHIPHAYAFTAIEDNDLCMIESAWDSDAFGKALIDALSSEAYFKDLVLSGRIPCDKQPLISNSISYCQKPTGAAAAANISFLLKSVFNEENICIEIKDRRFPLRCGRWLLNGEKTDRTPDIVMDIGSFIQLVFGYRSLSQLIKEEKAEICSAFSTDSFDTRFPVQQCFTWDEY